MLEDDPSHRSLVSADRRHAQLHHLIRTLEVSRRQAHRCEPKLCEHLQDALGVCGIRLDKDIESAGETRCP